MVREKEGWPGKRNLRRTTEGVQCGETGLDVREPEGLHGPGDQELLSGEEAALRESETVRLSETEETYIEAVVLYRERQGTDYWWTFHKAADDKDSGEASRTRMQ